MEESTEKPDDLSYLRAVMKRVRERTECSVMTPIKRTLVVSRTRRAELKEYVECLFSSLPFTVPFETATVPYQADLEIQSSPRGRTASIASAGAPLNFTHCVLALLPAATISHPWATLSTSRLRNLHKHLGYQATVTLLSVLIE